MKNISFLLGSFIFTLFPHLSLGQTYSGMVPDSEILDFLRWELHDSKPRKGMINHRVHKMYPEIIPWDSLHFMSSTMNKSAFCLFGNGSQLDSLFDESARNYFLEQIKAIIRRDWKHVRPKNRWKPNRYRYSIPLFSNDRAYVLIYKRFYCGSHCGDGGYLLFKKAEKKWKFVGVFR